MSSTSPKHILARLSPTRHKHGAQALHPYFGKVDPSIASAMIEKFSSPGDIVLDPFCGSGTVLHEATRLGRCAIGWDSSPLAVLIATAKVLGLRPEERTELSAMCHELEAFSNRTSLFRRDVPVNSVHPEMPRVHDVNSWFAPNALVELAFLRKYLQDKTGTLTPAARILVDVAMSRIVVAASNQQGESSYRRIAKPDHPGRVIALFTDSLRTVQTSAAAFQRLRGDNERTLTLSEEFHEVRWSDVWVRTYCRDSRVSHPDSLQNAALVVSSPPYLMSWDYGLYHKFRFYWLGWDLDKYEHTEIGRHLRRKKDDVASYKDDMARAFRSFSSWLHHDAHVVLVNAPSVVYGEEVDTNRLLGECGREAGWMLRECIPTLEIPGPHHGMYASLPRRGAKAAGKKGKREHVLIFQRV